MSGDDVRRAVPIVEPRLPEGLDDQDELVLGAGCTVEQVLATGASIDGDGPIEEVTIARSRLVGAALTGSTFAGLDLRDVILDGCELSGVTVDQGRFERVELRRCRMSAFVAPQLEATDVSFVDCKLDEAWLRMATLVRCRFEGCEMTGADLYEVRATDSRFVGCTLDGAELTRAALERVALHGSSLEGVIGGAALRNVVISGDQIVPVALAVFAGVGVQIDDEFLDPLP